LKAAIVAKEILDTGVTLDAAAKRGRIDLAPLKELALMTAKPFLYVVNSDDALLSDAVRRAELEALVAPSEAIFIDAKLESELAELDEADAVELLAATGQAEPGLNHLARVGFATLGLQTFLTAGPKEARAWTIRRGWTAPQAAGTIHTDFERGFIKAEVVSFSDLVELGGLTQARAAGRLRMEGKDYVMVDGDVVEFRSGIASSGKK
jgi:ribosome-binding ATPase YchF (GTP1/OBG family)